MVTLLLLVQGATGPSVSASQAEVTWRVQFAVGTAIALALVAYRWTLLQAGPPPQQLPCCCPCCSDMKNWLRRWLGANAMWLVAAHLLACLQESKVWKAERHDVAEHLAQKGVSRGTCPCCLHLPAAATAQSTRRAVPAWHRLIRLPSCCTR